MILSTDDAREAEALRAMLIKLDEIEAIMNDAAYSETGERKIGQLRTQWTNELTVVEFRLTVTWTAPDT